MDKVISEWSKEYQLKSYGGCLCGSYICNLDELGCLGLEVRCRKSNSCPTSQDWIIEDSIVLFNQNLVGEDNCILNGSAASPCCQRKRKLRWPRLSNGAIPLMQQKKRSKRGASPKRS